MCESCNKTAQTPMVAETMSKFNQVAQATHIRRNSVRDSLNRELTYNIKNLTRTQKVIDFLNIHPEFAELYDEYIEIRGSELG